MKNTRFAMLTIIFVSATAATHSLGQQKHPRPATRHKLSCSPVIALLNTPVKHVAWNDAPLSDVFDWLRSFSNPSSPVNILPRWRALLVENIDKDTPITLEMSDTSVKEILIEILDGLSTRDRIQYIGSGNKLRITTRADIRRRLVSRSYDINQIIAQVRGQRVSPRFISGRTIHIVTFFPVTDAGVGVTTQPIDVGTSMFGDEFFGIGNNTRTNTRNDDDDDQDDEEDIIRDLLETIYTTIEPSTWNVNGGNGSASVFNGILTIRNSIDVHALIGASFIVSR